MSNNRITGKMDLSIFPLTSKATFDASVNRLSGPLQVVALDQFYSLSVLNGNVISCSTLPHQDVFFDRYFCGTKNLEISLYMWLCVSIVSSIALVLVYFDIIAGLKAKIAEGKRYRIA